MRLEIVTPSQCVMWSDLKIGQVVRNISIEGSPPFIKGWFDKMIYPIDWSIGTYSGESNRKTFEILGEAKFTE